MNPRWLPGITGKHKAIRLVFRRAISSLLAGMHQSRHLGTGLVFDEVRPYQPGDEVRAIDWNVTARLGEPFVKRFTEERDQRVMVLMDLSSSTNVGMGLYSKREVAAEIFALLSIVCWMQGDRIGLAGFTSQLEFAHPPGKGMSYATRLVHTALTFEPKENKTSLAAALRAVCRMDHRRGMLVVLSDFLDEGWEKALSQAAAQHDLIAIRLSDPIETLEPLPGLVRFGDVETAAHGTFSSPRVLEANDAVKGSSNGLMESLVVTTDGSHLEKVTSYLHHRAKRWGRR